MTPRERVIAFLDAYQDSNERRALGGRIATAWVKGPPEYEGGPDLYSTETLTYDDLRAVLETADTVEQVTFGWPGDPLSEAVREQVAQVLLNLERKRRIGEGPRGWGSLHATNF